MKKILTMALAFVMVFTVFASVNSVVRADEHDNGEEEAPTDRKVVVHYHRWDGDYDDFNLNLWTWDTGTDGSEPAIMPSGYSDFGMTFDIYVDEDAAPEIGLIIRFDMGWGGDDRDGLYAEPGDGDVANKFITVKDDGEFVGFDEDGVKHVFVYEGMADVIYQDELFGPLLEDTGTLAVVFYDPDEYVDVEEYDIWTWGAGEGGFEANDEDGGVPLDTVLGVHGQLAENAMFRVAHIPIGEDADDEIGIIFRTAGVWGEFQTENLSADVSELKGSGFDVVFFGMENKFDNFAAFEAFALPASIDHAAALDPGSLLVEFNKGIPVRADGEEIFDLDWFTLLDNEDNEVTIDSASFTQGLTSVEEFMLLFDEANKLNVDAAPYTLIFQSDPEDEATRTEIEVAIPDEAPTIRIIGATDIEIELGDAYSLPSFTATEIIDDEPRPLYDVRVKEGHGYLSTRDAGIYEIVIEAEDTFGNRTEETITVTVIDICDPEAHLATNLPVTQMIYGTISVLSLLGAAAFIVTRYAKGGKH